MRRMDDEAIVDTAKLVHTGRVSCSDCVILRNNQAMIVMSP